MTLFNEDTHICHCGSCREAFQSALAETIKGIKAGDCLLWRIQIASALSTLLPLIGKATVADAPDFPPSVIEAGINHAVAQFGERACTDEEWKKAGDDIAAAYAARFGQPSRRPN